jgi:hypothetical protein
MQSSIPVADGRIGYLLMAMMPQLTRRVPTTMYGRPFTVVGLRKGDRFETLKKIKVKRLARRSEQNCELWCH